MNVDRERNGKRPRQPRRSYRTTLKLSRPGVREAVNKLAEEEGSSISSTLEGMVEEAVTERSFARIGWGVVAVSPDGDRTVPLLGRGVRFTGLPKAIEEHFGSVGNDSDE